MHQVSWIGWGMSWVVMLWQSPASLRWRYKYLVVHSAMIFSFGLGVCPAGIQVKESSDPGDFTSDWTPDMATSAAIDGDSTMYQYNKRGNTQEWISGFHPSPGLCWWVFAHFSLFFEQITRWCHNLCIITNPTCFLDASVLGHWVYPILFRHDTWRSPKIQYLQPESRALEGTLGFNLF